MRPCTDPCDAAGRAESRCRNGPGISGTPERSRKEPVIARFGATVKDQDGNSRMRQACEQLRSWPLGLCKISLTAMGVLA